MIWLIGSKGMLGQEIAGLLEENGLDYCGTDRETDITELEALRDFLKDREFSWVINCSAYTAVEKAEEEQKSAYLINETGVLNIGKVAAEKDIPVIHLSTDYVFNGKKDLPLTEEEPTDPVSVYGASKLAGEKALQSQTSRCFIIRTAWLYGRYGNNFVYTMLKLMASRDNLKVVSDQIGSPSWTYDLASLIVEIIRTDSRAYGIYHFSGEGKTSWYGFAREIYRQGRERGILKGECDVNSCTSEEFPAAVERPAFSLLSKEKIKNTFNWAVPTWEESLDNFFNRGLDL